MKTIFQILQEVQLQLQHVAQENAALEARILAQHAWGITREALLKNAHMPVTDSQIDQLQQLAARRLAREPMSHILGYKDFWKDQFHVTADVLTPRADSETMIEALLDLVPDKTTPLRILELGVGSGCLILSALREYPQARGVGVDRSPAALAVARRNAADLGLSERMHFIESDWCKLLDKAEQFDIILTNPPYIAHAEIASLMPEVQGFEPHLALDGGNDGLACYRAIFAEILPHIKTGSWILAEVGTGQASEVSAIAVSHGYKQHKNYHDLGGIARIVVVRK